MIIKQLECKKNGGLDKIDAQTIAKRAMRFDSEIFFEHNQRKINAKSLMGVIALSLNFGDKVMLIIKGEDQDMALTEFETLFAKNFKE